MGVLRWIVPSGGAFVNTMVDVPDMHVAIDASAHLWSRTLGRIIIVS
jgi:hypothetical protein